MSNKAKLILKLRELDTISKTLILEKESDILKYYQVNQDIKRVKREIILLKRQIVSAK